MPVNSINTRNQMSFRHRTHVDDNVRDEWHLMEVHHDLRQLNGACLEADIGGQEVLGPVVQHLLAREECHHKGLNGLCTAFRSALLDSFR